jgi:hypothetical protein
MTKVENLLECTGFDSCEARRRWRTRNEDYL